MKAVAFEGHNDVLAKDQPQYQQLPVYMEPDKPEFPITACFQLDKQELEEIAKTGLIWHTQWTFRSPFQPVSMTTACPFQEQPAIIPRTIVYLKDIDQSTPEGKLFFEALTFLTTRLFTKNTPEEIISALFNGTAKDLEEHIVK